MQTLTWKTASERFRTITSETLEKPRSPSFADIKQACDTILRLWGLMSSFVELASMFISETKNDRSPANLNRAIERFHTALPHFGLLFCRLVDEHEKKGIKRIGECLPVFRSFRRPFISTLGVFPSAVEFFIWWINDVNVRLAKFEGLDGLLNAFVAEESQNANLEKTPDPRRADQQSPGVICQLSAFACIFQFPSDVPASALWASIKEEIGFADPREGESKPEAVIDNVPPVNQAMTKGVDAQQERSVQEASAPKSDEHRAPKSTAAPTAGDSIEPDKAAAKAPSPSNAQENPGAGKKPRRTKIVARKRTKRRGWTPAQESRIKAAIKSLGKNTTAKAIIDRARVKEQAGRKILRSLEKAGAYSGFTRH
jgi:hypothetical protein